MNCDLVFLKRRHHNDGNKMIYLLNYGKTSLGTSKPYENVNNLTIFFDVSWLQTRRIGKSQACFALGPFPLLNQYTNAKNAWFLTYSKYLWTKWIVCDMQVTERIPLLKEGRNPMSLTNQWGADPRATYFEIVSHSRWNNAIFIVKYSW